MLDRSLIVPGDSPETEFMLQPIINPSHHAQSHYTVRRAIMLRERSCLVLLRCHAGCIIMSHMHPSRLISLAVPNHAIDHNRGEIFDLLGCTQACQEGVLGEFHLAS